MHDNGQLSGKVPIVGFHLIVILLLILFNQSLIDAQAVATCLYKMPAQIKKGKLSKVIKPDRTLHTLSMSW